MTDHDPTRFDAIAGAYADFGTENTPIRKYAETYTVLKHAGPLDGACVLDAACSDGFFSRLLHQAGAKHVLGLDISAAMINVAEARTDTPDIRYTVGNVLDLTQTPGGFDFVMSSFAQSYAKDVSELYRICDQFFKQLTPGGRILTLNDNPFFLADRMDDYKKYGKSKNRAPDTPDGGTISVCWHCTDSTGTAHDIPFTCHYYGRETLIAAFTSAGFVDVEIHETEVSPQGLARFGPDYWQLLIENSIFCVITAKKPS